MQTQKKHMGMEVHIIPKEDIDELIAKVDKIQVLLKKALSMDKSSQWLDNEEFCKTLSISRRTAQRLRLNKALPYTQVGTKVLYKRTEVEAFLERHRIKSNEL